MGILTYTNDQRFQSLHTEGSDEWTLRISSPQPRDSGTYECQVSTEPKISQGFRLNVVGEYLCVLNVVFERYPTLMNSCNSLLFVFDSFSCQNSWKSRTIH